MIFQLGTDPGIAVCDFMRVLVVEDNGPLRLAMAQRLIQEGYAVDHTADGQEGSWFIQENDYAVGVLDLMLPSRSGYELLGDFRKSGSSAGILIITARDAISDRVAGLDAGADDYLVKPFAIEEFMARVRALVRRRTQAKSSTVQVGDLVIDLARREVRRGQLVLCLTSKEFSLLELLALHKNEVVSRGEIWEQLYDFNQDACSNVIDVFVARLRKKVDRDSTRPLIHTKRGQGYVLSDLD